MNGEHWVNLTPGEWERLKPLHSFFNISGRKVISRFIFELPQSKYLKVAGACTCPISPPFYFNTFRYSVVYHSGSINSSYIGVRG